MGDITIHNLRHEKPSLLHEVKVCRPSVLGNPFKLSKNASIYQRGIVCDRYEDYIEGLIVERNERIIMELDRLYRIYKECNMLKLYCWCTPKRCHAEIIKRIIEEHYDQRES